MAAFAGFSLLWTLDTEGGVERFWAKATATPPWPARLTRTRADAPGLAAPMAQLWAIAPLLAHPGLVRGIASGTEGPHAWVAHEVVDGVPLHALLTALAQTGHMLPADVAIGIAGRVCAALAFVHAASGPDGRQLMLTHSGICPQNVWLLRDGTVKLDGLRAPDDPRPFPGDPTYLAPELSSGGRPDPRSDLYALGVLTAELLVGGRPPLDPSGLAQALARRADVPEALPGLVAELCAADRDARPQLARMLTQRLDNLLGLVAEPVGLARYVSGGVQHLSPASPEHPPTQLLAEVRAAGVAYPPGASQDLTLSPVAPSGHDQLSAPALSLPTPSASTPLTLPNPTPETPRLLDFSSSARAGPPPGAPRPKKWDAGAEVAGMPAWLLVSMAVLSVVGAVALARWLLPGGEDEADPRARRRAMSELAAPASAGATPLEITSTPPGAAIFVNGKRADGVTPFAPPDLRNFRKVEVFVSKAGFADTSPRTVTLNPLSKETIRLHFDLRPLRRFRIETDPPGAAAKISGRQSEETTPFWLDAVTRGETVSIDFRKRGYMPGFVSFTAGTHTPTVSATKLAPARLFDIISEPPGITVRIDGESIGKTPIEEHAVALGRRFELELRRPDVSPYKKTITAKGPLVRKLNLKLRSRPFAKLPLTSSERDAYQRISAELKAAMTALRRSKSRLQSAKKRVRTFETASDIRVAELEEAQAEVDEAEAEVAAQRSVHETKQLALDELRAEVVERLEME